MRGSAASAAEWSPMLEPGHYDFERAEMLRYLPASLRSVLDVGCASGRFTSAMRKRFPDADIWGIDPVAYDDAGRFRRIVGRFPDDLPGELRFDCIVFNDVLEHLVDPWEALRATLPLLLPGGSVVASIPNIRNIEILRALVVHGRWQYADIGILDRTHLRFFTRSGIVDLFECSGWRVRTIEPLNIKGRPRHAVNRLSRGRLSGFVAEQFAVVATPAP
jgi:2-polyprenyl-3-methyl-5-hydroxy-6-metoxy-1,4-benzoquinol methylase